MRYAARGRTLGERTMVAVLDSLRSMFGKSRDTVKGKYCKAIEAVADGKGSATEAMASVIHEMGKTLEEFEADVEEFRKRRAWVADIQKAVEARSRMDAPGVKFDMIGMVDEKFNADMRRIDEELREIRAGETSERISKDEASRLRKAANEEASEVNEARRARAYALRATIAAGEAAEGFLRMSAHQSFHDK
jgi:DNA repair ATPase RecN